MKNELIFVLGCTNSGKSTFIESVKKEYPQIGTVEIGKMMRAKYPPSHFDGQSNPTKTADEALRMMIDGIAQNVDRFATLIDGQPRDIPQCKFILSRYTGQDRRILFVNLYAPRQVREARARARDGNDPEKLKLSMSRLDGDAPSVNEVLCMLMANSAKIVTFDTSLPGYDPVRCFDMTQPNISINGV